MLDCWHFEILLLVTHMIYGGFHRCNRCVLELIPSEHRGRHLCIEKESHFINFLLIVIFQIVNIKRQLWYHLQLVLNAMIYLLKLAATTIVWISCYCYISWNFTIAMNTFFVWSEMNIYVVIYLKWQILLSFEMKISKMEGDIDIGLPSLLCLFNSLTTNQIPGHLIFKLKILLSIPFIAMLIKWKTLTSAPLLHLIRFLFGLYWNSENPVIIYGNRTVPN